MPAESRAYAYMVFGPNRFPIRKDMLNNTVGYREASVGDIWSEMSRAPQPAQKAFMDTTTFLLGKNTFKILGTAEQAWKAGVSVARSTIVVKSVIVPMANIASNFLQLMPHGVPIRSIKNGMATKLVEIDQHLRNLQRNVETEALKARHHKDPVMLRRLEVEQKALRDSSQRMSIWPLIEQGEFSSISEGVTARQFDLDKFVVEGHCSTCHCRRVNLHRK